MLKVLLISTLIIFAVLVVSFILLLTYSLIKISGQCSRWEEEHPFTGNKKHACIYNIDAKCYERPCIECYEQNTCKSKCTCDCTVCKGFVEEE